MSTITDPPTAQERATALREEMLGIISTLSVETLADAAKHEYDDEAAVPAAGSSGAAFLLDGRDRLVDWVRAQGRFPQSNLELDAAGATWHHAEAVPSLRAQAFVDLGLYFSHHAYVGGCPSIAGINQVLDAAAEQLTITLVGEYGPLV